MVEILIFWVSVILILTPLSLRMRMMVMMKMRMMRMLIFQMDEMMARVLQTGALDSIQGKLSAVPHLQYHGWR